MYSGYLLDDCAGSWAPGSPHTLRLHVFPTTYGLRLTFLPSVPGRNLNILVPLYSLVVASPIGGCGATVVTDYLPLYGRAHVGAYRNSSGADTNLLSEDVSLCRRIDVYAT